MNLLKQTALVLGLVSLCLGGWTLFRNWRQKLAIVHAILCFVVAGWALSFVSHATLGGRLSKDIHWIFNVWLAPVGVTVVAQILSAKDLWAKWLQWISFSGGVVLSLAIGFSITALTEQEWFWVLVRFWPTFILAEYLHVMAVDFFQKRPVNIDFISKTKRRWLYAGLGVSLAICTFDHIPWTGYFVPSIGNLLFTLYLVFASQALSPQKLMGVEAILSRFFAISILSLVITGYFALLYQYMSETFGLFLLNSFLISFATLVLWNPLVTLFRFLGRRIFKNRDNELVEWLASFKMQLSGVTSQVELGTLFESFFAKTLQSKEVKIEFDLMGLKPPDVVRDYFFLNQKRDTPILHRTLLQMELDQALSSDLQRELKLLIQYLDLFDCDLVFPVFSEQKSEQKIIALIRIGLQTSIDEWKVSLAFYKNIFDVLQGLASALQRIQQVENTLEKDRLALLGEMAAGLAHEIRNPLGAIKGASELLTTESKNDGAWAKVIQEEVNRLNRLVSQFLDFSHASPDQPDSVDLQDLIERGIARLLPSLPNGVEIELVPPSGKVQAMVVPDQIQQVLINLLQNAVKANQPSGEKPNAGARVQVQVFNTGFIVTDNGVGMSEETLARVYQPFFSGFSTGSGLGLSICKRLIASNEGNIEIQSRLGEGTTVKVTLCETRSS